MDRQGLAVEGVSEKRLGTQRLVDGDAAPVLLLHRVLPSPELDFLGSPVRPEEDDLPRALLDPRFLQNVAQGKAGPAAVRNEALHRLPAVARALEAGIELRLSHAPDLVEGELTRTVNEPGHFQPVRLSVDRRVAEVLRREELVLGRERPVDLPQVQDPSIGSADRREALRNVGERDDSLARSEGRECPLRERQNAQSRDADSKNVSSSRFVGHFVRLLKSDLPVYHDGAPAGHLHGRRSTGFRGPWGFPCDPAGRPAAACVWNC